MLQLHDVHFGGYRVSPSPLVKRKEAVIFARTIVVHPLTYIELKHMEDTDYLAWLTEAIEYAVNGAIGPMVSAALQKIDRYSKEES